MTERLKGRIEKLFCQSPRFTAGLLQTQRGETLRFTAQTSLAAGDWVELQGDWVLNAKYGHQFQAQSVKFDIPDDAEGLLLYLTSPRFAGLAYPHAVKLAQFASPEVLELVLFLNPSPILRILSWEPDVLERLRRNWLAGVREMKLRTHYAAYGLTPDQALALECRFGDRLLDVLNNDPYRLVGLLPGLSFQTVDQRALSQGISRDHPARLQAGTVFTLQKETEKGHIWTNKTCVAVWASSLLGLKDNAPMDSVLRDLADEGRVMDVEGMVALPDLYWAESHLGEIFETQGKEQVSFPVSALPCEDLQDLQRKAYEQALDHRLSVITGSAGTGKTFLIAHLVRTFQKAHWQVALCAPTGKAAQRMEEMARQAGICSHAHTIHRLLEYDGSTYHRDNLSEPVVNPQTGHIEKPAYQAIIVDEVSMVDVPLMHELLRRINFDLTQVILVGDHHQLPPVGPGHVLRDILEEGLLPSMKLTKVLRHTGVLERNANLLLSGQVGPNDDSAWVVMDKFRTDEEILEFLKDFYEEGTTYWNYDPFRDVQILTPTHKSDLGTENINSQVQAWLHGPCHEKPFLVGDRVIQTENDYELGVMNGTIGYVLEITKHEMVVAFEGIGERTLTAQQQQRVSLAYALTAHKAQGSEFPCVVVLCFGRHVHRSWLYTAVTRAQNRCILVGNKLNQIALQDDTFARRTLLLKWFRAQVASEAQSVSTSSSV